MKNSAIFFILFSFFSLIAFVQNKFQIRHCDDANFNPPNFRSFPIQALMSLFVLSCKDGWVNIMYDGLDAVGVDQQVTVQD